MDTLRKHLSQMDYETRCECARYIQAKYITIIDTPTRNYILSISNQDKILKDIQEAYNSSSSSIASSDYTPSDHTTENDIDENNVEDAIKELQQKRKRLTDRIYSLRKKHFYKDDKDVDNIADLFP